ncbi:hypothetical protein GH714_034686 [Hevea brasiliensis]|uniref:Rab-GAP TBC domain-containing protein n=1 Tax=Hevea brasiliensis TaxID=3981 RepID=A0A6A6L4F8_HEVBR|nr:hypothetical protein GH714_034686 [Hevea brasiliensis]
MMSIRVKKGQSTQDHQETKKEPSIEDAKSAKGVSEEDSEDEFYDVERSDPVQEGPSGGSVSASGTGATAADVASLESLFPWKEELDVLVRGGVPMALRGELWQAFVGVKTRRVERYYQDLLASETISGNHVEQQSDSDSKGATTDPVCIPEKWKGQIEKDLPRTFPGHPALDDDGRNALRRLLTAYARHNPSVGYCQAMNFFAALLLLLMPEENAFWALMGIIDDYFDGYYSEEMIESQVMLATVLFYRLPIQVNHLDYLGVQVAWVSGPWFLSIFMNMLPWESVLRVWDVLLFEGNRVMLFRTALALMELYGPALVTTKDAGDAVTLLQSLAGSTFDSSQLVLTGCMGYQNVNEIRLQELRNKHRPTVIAAVEERTKGLQAWRDSQGLASKLYNFKHDPKSMLVETNKQSGGDLSRSGSGSTNSDEVLISLTGTPMMPVASFENLDSIFLFSIILIYAGGVVEGRIVQVARGEKICCTQAVAIYSSHMTKLILYLLCAICEIHCLFFCILLGRRVGDCLMEMVKQDNRRQLSARKSNKTHRGAAIQKWKKLDKLLEEQIERRDKLFQEAQSKSQFQDLELRSQIPGGFTENGKKTENIAALTNEDALELCLAQGGKTLQHLEQDFLPHMSSISEVFGEENDEDIEDNNHGTEVYWGDDKELGKTKEGAAKKEIVLLDDKIHGDGNVKKSIQKEQKFQILKDLIQLSFENDVNGANDENTQGFENDNITEASSKVHMRQLDYSMGRIGAEYEV